MHPTASPQASAPPLTNRRSVFLYAAALLGCYLLFLLLTLPASWADWLLTRASHNVMHLQQTEGSLWSGRGQLIIQRAGQLQMLSRVTWSVQPLWLFTGKLQIQLQTPDTVRAGVAAAPLTPAELAASASLNATVRIGYHHLAVQSVDVTFPASALSAVIPVVDLVAPRGRLQITTSQATLTTTSLDGDLQLTWLNAGARLGGLNEAGDYRLVVSGRGPSAELRIETLRGDVAVTAQGEWQLPGEGRVQLTGSITPGRQEQLLHPLMNMMNLQNENGQYNFRLDSRYPAARLFAVR